MRATDNVGGVRGGPTWGCLGAVVIWAAFWFGLVFPLIGLYHW